MDLKKTEEAVLGAKRSFSAERERANVFEDELLKVKGEQDEFMVKSLMLRSLLTSSKPSTMLFRVNTMLSRRGSIKNAID